MSAITSGITPTPAANSENPYAELTSGEFLNIIFSELTNQDPLAPSETKDILEQISLIRSIESDAALSDDLGELVKQNEIASASSFVGKFVTGRTGGLDDAVGFVDSVSITRDGIVLNLSSGQSVNVDQVEEIVDPALIGIADPNASTQPPQGVSDNTTLGRGGTAVIDVLANDRADQQLDPTSVRITNQPSNAVDVSVDPSTGEITYVHDGGDSITDSFTYTVADVLGNRSEATTVNVIIGGDDDGNG
jgi:flagellar basal-body rod modification protein FlgD